MGDAGIVTWDAKYIVQPLAADHGDPGCQSGRQPGHRRRSQLDAAGSPGDGVRAELHAEFPVLRLGARRLRRRLFTTLADFYGTDNMTFTIGSQEVPGVYYTFHSFSAASEQNAMSRIYLGIHFMLRRDGRDHLG